MNHSNTNPRSFSPDQLHAALGDVGGPARPEYLADIVAQAGRTRQRPAWTIPESWLSTDIAVPREGVPRVAVLFAALFLLIAILLAGVVYIGSVEQPGPDRRLSAAPSVEPVRRQQGAGPERFGSSNGLIAFAADARAGDALTDPLDHGIVETRPGPMDIYVIREGEPTRRLVATDAHERCPAFSPDGQRLAYLEGPAPGVILDPSIVVVQLNAAEAPSVPEMRAALPWAEVYRPKNSIGVPCPQWSPDGRQIAYLAYQFDPQKASSPDVVAELHVSTIDGQEIVLNSAKPSYVDRPFAWSPDSEAIAFAAAIGVWRAPLDGSAPSLIWTPDGRPTSVSWSSRGELAVTVRTEVAVEGGGSRDVKTVHVVDVNNGSERSLDSSHVYDYGAEWSPDGSRLAIVDENGHVTLSDRDDGSITSLSPRYEDGREMLFGDVAWSPDGERLLALTRSDIGFALVSLSTDGATVDVLTPRTWAMDWINLEDMSWQSTTN